MISPWIAFLAWVPISLYCFHRYRVRVAILINFIAAWGVLPGASFARETAGFPYWILGTCLPSIHFFTKATVPSLTCLLGILLVDRRVLSRFKLSFYDLPMLVWCVVPLLSAVANAQGLVSALRSELYQTLAWGVPYLVGRLYFVDAASLKLAAKAFVIAGIAYVPICLLELFTGPQIYAHLYGYQPYRWIGAQRYFGFRPIGLLEDGNQLGIWMATAALLAIWLWRRRLATTVLGIPIAWASGVLFVVTLLCQSGGSIVLLLCLLPFVFVRQRHLPRALIALLLLAIVGAIGLRLANVVSLQSLVKQNPIARSAAYALRKVGRGSFGWRLSQDEKHVTSALETPALGTGEWDWWQASASRPWGLWLLAFGMYGTVGLLALEGLQLLPVARVVWFPSGHGGKEGAALRSALAATILMSAIDNLLNGSMILPLLLVIGGLSAEGVTLAAGVVSQGRVVPQPAPAAKSSSTPVILRRSVAGNRIAKLP
jgi:hypothetical protein